MIQCWVKERSHSEQGRDICARLISARVESQISQAQTALVQSRLRSISGDPPPPPQLPLFLIPADTAQRRFHGPFEPPRRVPFALDAPLPVQTVRIIIFFFFITTASARRMGFPISGAHFGLPLPGLASGNRGRGGWVWGSGSQINK